MPVSEEVPLTIEVNGRELATLLCSPEHLKNLVIGFLFTNGLIQNFSWQKSLTIDTERWKAGVKIEGDGFADISRDDIGRHNAIDKVIGEDLYTNAGFSRNRRSDQSNCFAGQTGRTYYRRFGEGGQNVCL